MRSRLVAAALSLTAAPVFAQSRDVTGPWTLTPGMVMCVDNPVAVKPAPRLFIKGAYHVDERLANTMGGQVLITRTPDDGLAPGQSYISARLMTRQREFPRPGEGFGDVRITGVISVTAVDNLNAVGQVEFACDSIENGDFLEPFTETVLPPNAAAMQEPDFSDRAQLLFGEDNRVMVGLGYIISIDRGTLHGVVTGSRFAIYRDRRDTTPLVYLGEAVVLSTAEQTSKVMITKANDALMSGDLAVPRRQP